MKKNAFILFFLFIYTLLSAQTLEDFGFQRNSTILVFDSIGDPLNNAWGGGLNSCHFSEIDLNNDGIRDLFIYDRSSAKIITFINNGSPGVSDYTFAPEYRNSFPEIHYWAELLDYNNDGKEDIFTYSYGGGISVYRNISDGIDGVKFVQAVETVMTLQDAQLVNLLVTPVDFPGISDIDGDGDYDILNFWGLGEYVQLHKNISMELYGTSDSLVFERQDFCWGNFSECTANNSITLNINCPGKESKPKDTNGIEHTGSTLLALDLNGDNLKDILIGDVDYPGIIALFNGGTPTDAQMIAKDTIFPSNTTKIDLVSFPVISYLDINNDNKKELIASPFDANMLIAENQRSCWLYENTGTNASPVFEYNSNDFLQKDMIDLGAGAYPVLFDYDSDGLIDLFISNFGKHDSSYYSGGFLYSIFNSGISLYKNTGTSTSPEFTFITDDFAGIESRKLTGVYPAFGDIDNDGAAEMIIGKSNGKLDLYENIAPSGQPMEMILSQVDYMGIYIGNTITQSYPSATPQLFDLDKDALLDLIIGEKSGTLNYFRNTGSSQVPQFTLITDSLGMVDVVKHASSNYGFSVPCFFSDSSGNTKLFSGSESGYIYYYKDVDGNLNGTFTLQDSMLLFLYDGIRSSAAVANLDNDNYPDLITGNYSGGVCFFRGTYPPPAGIASLTSGTNTIELYPNPATDELRIAFSEGISKGCIMNVFDSKGTCTLTKHIPDTGNTFSLDTRDMRSGIYFVRIYDAVTTFSYCAKFVISK